MATQATLKPVPVGRIMLKDVRLSFPALFAPEAFVDKNAALAAKYEAELDRKKVDAARAEAALASAREEARSDRQSYED